MEKVMIPLMPKGVEHNDEEKGAFFMAKVMIPLMPKGVEHLEITVTQMELASSDDSIDAERR